MDQARETNKQTHTALVLSGLRATFSFIFLLLNILENLNLIYFTQIHKRYLQTCNWLQHFLKILHFRGPSDRMAYIPINTSVRSRIELSRLWNKGSGKLTPTYCQGNLDPQGLGGGSGSVVCFDRFYSKLHPVYYLSYPVPEAFSSKS